MKLRKIIGWLTFFAGILIIVFTLYSSYNIFTGKTPVPKFFELEKETEALPQGKFPTSPAELQKELGKMVVEQLEELLPLNTLPKMLNLAVWSMLAGILIFGGAQISNLGIKLIKD